MQNATGACAAAEFVYGLMNATQNMRSRSPRDYLTDQTPLQRHDEKRYLMLAWIGIHGHTIESVLMNLLNIKARGFCTRLEREGLLRRVPLALSRTAVWTLTREGVRLAEMALRRTIDFSAHPERLSLATLRHTLAVQRCCIQHYGTSLEQLGATRGDRELRSLTHEARPDLQIREVDLDGRLRLVHVEVELSMKSQTELCSKYAAILPLVARGVRWAWHLQAGQDAAERYRRNWLAIVEREGQGHGVELDGLREGCSFEFFPRD